MNAIRVISLVALILMAGCDRTPSANSNANSNAKTESAASGEIAAPNPSDVSTSIESDTAQIISGEATPIEANVESAVADRSASSADETMDAKPVMESPDEAMLAGDDPEKVADDSNADPELTDEVIDQSFSGEDSAPEIRSAYQLWLPTSKGPVLAGLSILVDGRPLRESFDEKTHRVWSAAAGETDGQVSKSLSWDALLAHVSTDAVTFGQTSARITGQEKGLIKQYDRNKNDLVDEEEFVRFLFRESNFPNEFRLFGTDAFRWSNRSSSPLFAAIDRNDDRKLDRDEIASAPRSLLRVIDQNADGCIEWSESNSLAEQDENAWRRTRSNRQGNVAMDLYGFVNWSNLSYAMGGMLKSDPVMAKANPVKLADANGDEWISAEEAETVGRIPPSILITVRFNSSDPAASVVDVALDASSSMIETQSVGGECKWISGGGLEIGVMVIDTAPTQNRIPREVFVQLDANKDGAIDESEIPDGAEEQLPLESLDENKDGKLTFMEINQALKQAESIWNYQVRARCAEHPDGVFAWLDADHDQFLSSREIQSVTDRFSALLDDSGVIESADIPDTVVIQFGRGEPNQDETRFEFKRRASASTESRPRWAIRMDANRDGDISEDEFLGPIDAFRELDIDGDRFLSTDEIAEADRLSL